MPSYKAAGVDGLQAEFFKAQPAVAAEFMHPLCNELFGFYLAGWFLKPEQIYLRLESWGGTRYSTQIGAGRVDYKKIP